ncbi:MAG: response regulator transcription factor [Sedimenticola sp.]|nr:response regulator transcription factor [Sedimenticola sp.]
MSRKIRLLVVEDETAIRDGLVDLFVFHGYEVESSGDGKEGLQHALTGQYDLVLLDVMLPGINGFDICARIRERDREQPIIMLTAKSGDEDVIQGLSLGADDYVAKPFSVAQLVLRVQAVLRRSRLLAEQAGRIELGDEVVLDCDNLSGRCGVREENFTRREMELLQYLHSHASRAVSRDELLNRVWGYARDLDLETRTVDIHVAKLRRKIEPDPANPRYLVTVRGAGYRLQVE